MKLDATKIEAGDFLEEIITMIDMKSIGVKEVLGIFHEYNQTKGCKHRKAMAALEQFLDWSAKGKNAGGLPAPYRLTDENLALTLTAFQDAVKGKVGRGVLTAVLNTWDRLELSYATETSRQEEGSPTARLNGVPASSDLLALEMALNSVQTISKTFSIIASALEKSLPALAEALETIRSASDGYLAQAKGLMPIPRKADLETWAGQMSRHVGGIEPTDDNAKTK